MDILTSCLIHVVAMKYNYCSTFTKTTIMTHSLQIVFCNPFLVNFCIWCKVWIKFIIIISISIIILLFLPIGFQLFQHCWILKKQLFFLHRIAFTPFMKIHTLYMCGPTILVYFYTDTILKSDSISSPTLFFFKCLDHLVVLVFLYISYTF